MSVIQTNSFSPSFDCIILGAGISGLIAGSLLIKKGYKVLILEKSRGVGGRLATRRILNQKCPESFSVFDHGIPLLKISKEDSIEFLSQLLPSDTLRNWEFKGPLGEKFIRPLPSMTALPKLLPANEKVIGDKKITRVGFHASQRLWSVKSEDGVSYFSKVLISSVPIPQLLEILSVSSFLLHEDCEELTKLEYFSSLSLLIPIDSSEKRVQSLFLKNPSSVFDWIIESQSKGISQNFGLCLIASHDWSQAHFGLKNEEIFNKLWKECSSWIPEDLKWSQYQIHRWKYAQPKKALKESFLELTFQGLEDPSRFFVCGDAFGNQELPSFERAMLSGKALAQNLCFG